MTIGTKAEYQANRAHISVTLSQFTVPLLSRIYHAFDGDMVSAIVLGEIAHRNVLAWLCEADNPEGLLDDASRRQDLMRPCNALSIAEACGLPRETVRRKVVSLIERGYAHRSEDGYIYLSQGVGNDFQDVTAEIVEALLSTAKQLQALLEERQAPLGPLRLEPRLAAKPPHPARRSMAIGS
jgi:hypothetical protein